jgi:AcrR family transcriptional regulator
MDAGEAVKKRPYKMKARAAAAEETKVRILEASESVGDELQFDEITLAKIAKRAGVSVQTVIRHFGSKERLFLATLVYVGGKMEGDRDVEPGAAAEEIVGILFDHYERFGHRILRMLAQEDRIPTVRFLVDIGRGYHVDWCKQAFGPSLKGLRGARRERRLAQFTALTDIYTWKVLRQDRGLDLPATKLAVVEMLEPLMVRAE